MLSSKNNFTNQWMARSQVKDNVSQWHTDPSTCAYVLPCVRTISMKLKGVGIVKNIHQNTRQCNCTRVSYSSYRWRGFYHNASDYFDTAMVSTTVIKWILYEKKFILWWTTIQSICLAGNISNNHIFTFPIFQW